MFSLDSRGGHNRRKFKTDFFEKWSPEMAYVLGFLYADGDIEDVRKSSRTQYTTITSVDKEILESIKKAMGSEHNLNYRAPRKVAYKNGKTYESLGWFKIFYSDNLSKLFLERKFNVFKRYFYLRPNRIDGAIENILTK